MATAVQQFVGREVHSRDGYKVGEIKEALFGGEYVLVRRSAFSRFVAPVGALEHAGERLTIPRTSMYLDSAPKVDPKHELSERDKARLDQFFLLKDAS